MTIMSHPSQLISLVHWRTHHPRHKHIKSDWDVHGHPHHYLFIENALLSREMYRL
ncbi:hypothetical protein MPNTM1_00616 [Mycolicibacterium parafortuitum]|uniref:Uncharacterized protein n=1 Tax=Mycolicibacterium parafortuitum TaxID=39692 RepID=A0A375YFL3_MYCPF|nr:hypothetical protein MPP7335_01620 [Mycolicibacterium parafortuitum]